MVAGFSPFCICYQNWNIPLDPPSNEESLQNWAHSPSFSARKGRMEAFFPSFLEEIVVGVEDLSSGK